MKDALDSLAKVPGVQLVMLATPDGVPIAVSGRASAPEAREESLALESTDPEGRGMPELSQDDACAAIASGWLTEVQQAVAQISWNEPERYVLKGERGSLVLQRTHNAILLVVLGRGQGHEEMRLSMESTLARIERQVGTGGREERGRPHGAAREERPGPIPSRPREASDVAPAEVIHLGHDAETND